MKKSQRISPIKNLAENNENKAASQLGQSNQALLQHENRLTELLDYRQEYLQRFNESGKVGMSGSQLQQYQKFIAKLDTAIAQQKQHIVLLNQQREQARHHWQQKHNRTQALDKTMQRYQGEEKHQKSRKEQREIEDNLQSRPAVKK